MKVEVEASAAIPATCAEAYAALTRPAGWANHWRGIAAIESAPEQWTHAGDRVRFRVRAGSVLRSVQFTLLEAEPDSLLRYYVIEPGAPDSVHEWRFVPEGDGCRATLAVESETRPGLGGFLQRRRSRQVRRLVLEILEGLRLRQLQPLDAR